MIGVLELSIEWFRDSEFVKEDKRIKICFDGELFILKIFLIDLEDEGVYKCVVKNDLGLVFCVFEFFVNELNKKLEFIEKMKFVNVIEGELVCFDVIVEGNLFLVVDWFKGKDKLDDEGCYVMMDDEEVGIFMLIVEDIVFEDVGMYKCVVVNEEG